MEIRPAVPTTAPELSVEIAALRFIVMAALEEYRDAHTPERCRKHGVGARRRRIGRPLPANVAVLGAAKSPELALWLEGQRAAQEILASFCAACGGCEWARK